VRLAGPPAAMPRSSEGGAERRALDAMDGQMADTDAHAVDAMGRRMWDKDSARERAEANIMFGPVRIGKRRDLFVPLPASQRTYLKQRTNNLRLDKDVGKRRLVTLHTIKPMQGGYWCSVCECLLKDSITYSDHVNGRRHNRNLGMNMKVEKVGVDRVREKLKAVRKEPEAIEPEDIAKRIQALEDEQDEKKKRKKEKKKKKRKGPADGPDEEGNDDEVAAKVPRTAGDEENDADKDEDEEQKMLKLMGLPTSFG